MKKCPNCNVCYPNEAEFCGTCRAQLVFVPDPPAQPSAAQQVLSAVKGKITKQTVANIIIFLLHIILAIVVLCVFVNAAKDFKSGGILIGKIQSVGGKTLEEAYYQNLSYIYEGYYTFTIAFGIFCSAVITSLGIKRIRK